MKDNYEYNPFSGVLDDDVSFTLVPRFNVNDMVSRINDDRHSAIELIGKQGRGKTSHLIFLQQQMKEYPLFRLNTKSSIAEILNHNSDVIFIDSIHHLNIFNRIKLFKEKGTVIYTTHWSRKLDCFLAGKKNFSHTFKGIDATTLNKIVNNRLMLATGEGHDFIEEFSEGEIESLIKKFGDNYRGIINHLYERFQ